MILAFVNAPYALEYFFFELFQFLFSQIIIFAILQFFSKALKELQNFIYLSVKQTAYVETTEMVFDYTYRNNYVNILP